jgi:hypothetical protein
MKDLKQKLIAAKKAHAALRQPMRMPDTKTYTRAAFFITLNGSGLDGSDLDTKRIAFNKILAQHNTVITYRKEKVKLANTIVDVRKAMLAALEGGVLA